MKTRNYILSILSLVILSFSSCGDDSDSTPSVVAEFSTDLTAINKGESIQFTNESENAAYFQWTFGDDVSSVSENPTHTYYQSGTFEAQLVAIGENGSVDSTSTVITVLDGNNTIYDGEGIEGVNVYDTWESIYTSYGADSVYYPSYYYYEDYGIYLNLVYYPNDGLAFVFASYEDTMSDDDEAYYIMIMSPYEGTTNEGIAIDVDFDNVIDAYGTAEDTYSSSGITGYFYLTEGIDFYSYGTGYVDEIDVYEPSSSSRITIDFISKLKSLDRTFLQD